MVVYNVKISEGPNILYISLSFRVGRGNNDFWRNHADNHFPKFADDNDDDLCGGDNDER